MGLRQPMEIALLMPKALPEVERSHPPFTDDYPEAVIGRESENIRRCLKREYDVAFANAQSELDREMIALSQVILGDVDLALASTSRLAETDRKDNVLFVATIELYRRRRDSEADALYSRFSNGGLSESALAQMAIGVSNRVPWEGYPFPDY
jgi:hypothetical protein